MELFLIKKGLNRREKQLNRAQINFTLCTQSIDSEQYQRLKHDVERISAQYQREVQNYESLLSRHSLNMSEEVGSEDERSVSNAGGVDDENREGNITPRNANSIFVSSVTTTVFPNTETTNKMLSSQRTEIIPTGSPTERESSDGEDYAKFVEEMKKLQQSKGFKWTPQHLARFAREEELSENKAFKMDATEIESLTQSLKDALFTTLHREIKECIMEDSERMKQVSQSNEDVDILVRSFINMNEEDGFPKLIEEIKKSTQILTDPESYRKVFDEIIRDSALTSPKRPRENDTMSPSSTAKKPKKAKTSGSREVVARKFEYGDFIIVKMTSGLREFIITRGKKGVARESNEITMHDAKELVKSGNVLRHIKG